jgi:nicotinate-nucleotide--dimethylbenzimidazole phosphoribosyltransferase
MNEIPSLTREQLMERLEGIGPLDDEAMRAARARQEQLTKPQGSLGQLEELVIRLAGMTGKPRPRFARKAVFVFAADHGVAAQGVSAYPQAVTAQMVLNFLAGGAAINVLARRVGARVIVADLGVASELPAHPELLMYRIGPGTRSFHAGPAMSTQEALSAITAGIEIVEAEIVKGLDLVATGEMGIGNTTSASAIVAAITGRPVADVTGRGTGIDEQVWRHKVAIIEQALAVNRPVADDPLDVLAKVGGYEIAGLVGVMLGAALHRLPVMVDGFISGAAALIAAELCPALRSYLIAAHVSVEIGHRIILERLELIPLLNLNLRLGEGTGAVMAMHLVDDAAAILNEMATFAEACVSTQEAADKPSAEKVMDA